ncbi:hypothetical protein Tco_0237121 [Tanacetum coccineum]
MIKRSKDFREDMWAVLSRKKECKRSRISRYTEDSFTLTADPPGYIADDEEDPSEEHELEDEDTKEEEPFEGSNETEPFKEDESAITPPPPGHYGARTFVRTSDTHGRSTKHLLMHFCWIRMRDDILEEDMPPQRRFVLTAPPLRCDVAESSATAAARAPRGQYDFVDDVETRQGLIHSPGHDARTIARVADRVEDAQFAGIRETISTYSFQDARLTKDIRLEIDVVRGQRTAYETELHEVRQAYLSSEARNRALLARLETLETHMSRMEWQRQRAEDDAVRQMMRTHVLEARAQIDTVEDTGSSC